MSLKSLLVMYVVQTKYLSQSKIFNLFNCLKYIMLVVRQLASSHIEIVYYIVLLDFLHCGIPILLYMISSHN